MLHVVEQAAGALLVLAVLADIFLTVLYARMGTSILANRLARGIWHLFRALSASCGKRRAKVLSFCGPTILVVLVAGWTLALAVGAGLFMHPAMGTGIRASEGTTQTDVIAAIYTGGASLSMVGSSNFWPQTDFWRLVFLLNSVIGAAALSLTLTYLMQIYGALQRRNAFGLGVHFLSGGTSDAAELLAGLGPRGEITAGYAILATLAQEMTANKESHHFYPALFYFRFDEPAYAVSRFTLVLLDLVTLIKSSLDDERYGWLKESGAVAQVWQAGLALATTLEDSFVKGGAPGPQPPEHAVAERWRRRYFAALQRLRQAGIATIANEQEGAAAYVALRSCWERDLTKLARSMAFDIETLDPAGTHPETIERRPDFRERLRASPTRWG